MHWWKKFLSNFFSDKRTDEPEELHIENNQKNERHEMKARMIYQYPKGEFRFPLIKDQSEASKPSEVRQSRPYGRRQEDEEREPKTRRPVQGSETKQVSAERRIIEPKIRRPFQPTHTPSPIYGFNRPIVKTEESNTPEDELIELKSQSPIEDETKTENPQHYIGNINEEAVFEGNLKFREDPGKAEETTFEINTWKRYRNEEINADSEMQFKNGAALVGAEGISESEVTVYEGEDTVFAGINEGGHSAGTPADSAIDINGDSEVQDMVSEITSEPEFLEAPVNGAEAELSSELEHESLAAKPAEEEKNTSGDSEDPDVVSEIVPEPEFSEARVNDTEAELTSEMEHENLVVSTVEEDKNTNGESEDPDVVSEIVPEPEFSEARVSDTEAELTSELEHENLVVSTAEEDKNTNGESEDPDVVSEIVPEPEFSEARVSDTEAELTSELEHENLVVSTAEEDKNTSGESEDPDVVSEIASEPEFSEARVSDTEAELTSELEHENLVVSTAEEDKNTSGESEDPDVVSEIASEPEFSEARVSDTEAELTSEMEYENLVVSTAEEDKNTSGESEDPDVVLEIASEPEFLEAPVNDAEAGLSSELEHENIAVSTAVENNNTSDGSEDPDVVTESATKPDLPEAPIDVTKADSLSEMEIEQSTASSVEADIDVVSETTGEPILPVSVGVNNEIPANEHPTKGAKSIPELQAEKISVSDKEKPRQHLPFNVLMLSQDRTKWQKQKQRERDNHKRGSIPATIAKAAETAETEIAAASDSPPKYFEFPALQLLKPPVIKEENTEWLNEQTALLDETMENFNVKARVVNASQGPSVTRFEVQPDKGVKVNKITNLSNDIKLSMAARDIRMEAPIPGTRSIGIELPNKESRPVQISEIIGEEAFLHAESPLTAALGLDISGEPIVTDLRKMPHGLIAGATGSGKSVCINSILVSLLYKARPDELKLMLIDPKMVELAPYNHIPHLVSPVITDVKAATAALKWAVDEMERRYELFVHAGVRDIGRFNYLAETKGQKSEHLPYIVIVIDELADLMMVAPAEVEESICRIAQKARACGIHLLIATQRPSVDVITGLIKANVPTRIAFAVSSQVDSRTVIDVSGAEKLLGRGDMLFLNNGSVKPVRLQGTFVSDEEIDRVIEHVRSQGEPNYLFQQEELLKKAEMQENEDELLIEACEFVVKQGSASTSLLQRHFRIGYNRAARLMEMMEDQGVISGAKGSKPRDVLIKEAELDLLKDSLVH
ncbi:DNA translocase FtsK [Siminovitchia acidinfaciens]|uniref:DNA translocase FtsK n=1 Tax=Siminovitchia acidinfaciens TaxID=2321395 RepID=A0A429Y4T8_9BACI|nr:DNA translocase FtsK [Siminovitchia acidinfaciens]RST76421.1 DNA translocase FtsK [Siminovitchia acidinfaciens]